MDGSMERAAGPNEAELQEQLEALRLSQQAYLEQTFKWLIEFVARYFPGDQLAMEDAMTDVHFIHTVSEGGKNIGALVYRFRKVPDKKAYFTEIGGDYKEGLEVPEVIFVDSETPQFEAPASMEAEGNLVEIPAEKLTEKIKDLRDELKRRDKLRLLRESV